MNNNCLAGMRCPKCGHKDRFFIRVECIATVRDDGVHDTDTHTWDNDSFCNCGNLDCDHGGTVGEFMA